MKEIAYILLFAGLPLCAQSIINEEADEVTIGGDLVVEGDVGNANNHATLEVAGDALVAGALAVDGSPGTVADQPDLIVTDGVVLLSGAAATSSGVIHGSILRQGREGEGGWFLWTGEVDAVASTSSQEFYLYLRPWDEPYHGYFDITLTTNDWQDVSSSFARGALAKRYNIGYRGGAGANTTYEFRGEQSSQILSAIGGIAEKVILGEPELDSVSGDVRIPIQIQAGARSSITIKVEGMDSYAIGASDDYPYLTYPVDIAGAVQPDNAVEIQKLKLSDNLILADGTLISGALDIVAALGATTLTNAPLTIDRGITTIAGTNMDNGFVQLKNGTQQLSLDPNEIVGSESLYVTTPDTEAIYLRSGPIGQFEVTVSEGEVLIDADLDVDGSTTLDGGLTVTGSGVAYPNRGIVLEGAGGTAGVVFFSGTPSGGGEGLTYADDQGESRYFLHLPGGNETSLGNRGSNGFVTINANDGTVGSTGEKSVATFRHDQIELHQDVTVDGKITMTAAQGDISMGAFSTH